MKIRVLAGGSVLALLAIFWTLPLYASIYAEILLGTIFMHVIMTTSWTIFSGPTGYISLASAAFFGVGIYVSAVLGKVLPLPLVILVGAAAAFALALVIGALTLRLRGIYFCIFTFGLVELIKHVLLWWEINMMGTRGRFVVVVDQKTVYYAMLAVLVILLASALLIRRSRFGLALQSIGQQEEAAAHIGINVTWIKTLAFAISACFMGAAGSIMATRWTYIDPGIAFNPLFSFMPVLMAIFGGMGRIYGPLIGAAVFAYLEEILITRFPYHYMLMFGAIMVLVIVFLPTGLVGLMQKWRKGGS
ncbi:MAG TPA: branched-chain amino acid ABC transporter permease [Anaerolineales bacterium]|nr:branched-chain amino acid ABC transporter permease [Anaerolineales bacterium]